MHPFKLIQARSSKAAVESAAGASSKFIAGGTNLIDLMKFEIETPQQVVDITALPLREIEIKANGEVRIGALVSNSDLAYHPLLSKRYPVLSEALLSGASPQLRNMATVGGNLMQRTRCPYFYDRAFACNKRAPQTGCSAIHGYHRSNAVLGGSDSCIATHSSDMCVALAALDATVHISGLGQDRNVLLTDFHTLPGDTPNIETVLQPGELITAVTIPELPFGRRSHYLKVRDRASYEFALASAAVALDVQDDRIVSARVALGGIGTKPWRSRAAELALTGAVVHESVFQEAANAALKDGVPRKHNAFKIELAKRTLVRALNTVGAMA